MIHWNRNQIIQFPQTKISVLNASVNGTRLQVLHVGFLQINKAYQISWIQFLHSHVGICRWRSTTRERGGGSGGGATPCRERGFLTARPRDGRTLRWPLWQAAAVLWLRDRMVFVSFRFFQLSFYVCPLVLQWFVWLENFLFCRFLMGFVFPPLWYYATVLYFGNYYHKDPRERPGLAASAIAVSRESREMIPIVGLFGNPENFSTLIHILWIVILVFLSSKFVLQALICSVAVIISLLAMFLS